MIDLSGSYCGSPPLPSSLLASWNDDPLLLVALVAGAVLALRLGGDRRPFGLAAVALLAVAFVSPLCAASVALFSARALHHLILVAIVAPLLARAWPLRSPLSRLAAVAIATITLWLWHVPAAYDAALSHKAIYWAMQASLILTSWACWSAIDRSSGTVAVTAIVGAAAGMGMLGAVLTFAPVPLYASHAGTTLPFGIGPLADQQLAGLIMWVPGLLPYAFAAGWRMRGEWRRMAAA